MGLPLHRSPDREASGNLPDAFRRLTAEELRGALRKMLLIRRFEEGAEDAYMRGLIHGTMHLSIGQEATAVGICMPLTDRGKAILTPSAHMFAAAALSFAGR